MNATFEAAGTVTISRTTKPAKRKILLVDNDPGIRQILRRLLTEDGFLVFTAAKGDEALEFIKITRFDLVLLDLKTQAKDEWETFSRLSTQNPLLPVVVIADRDDRFFHALALGGVVLEKPFNSIKLVHTIHNLTEEPAEKRLAQFTGRPGGFHYIPPKESTPQKIWRVN